MQKQPYIIECDAGKVAVCACGKSANLPRCDGSHKGSGVGPTIIDVEEKKTLAICGCGHTGNAPYCDGSHSKL